MLYLFLGKRHFMLLTFHANPNGCRCLGNEWRAQGVSLKSCLLNGKGCLLISVMNFIKFIKSLRLLFNFCVKLLRLKILVNLIDFEEQNRISSGLETFLHLLCIKFKYLNACNENLLIYSKLFPLDMHRERPTIFLSFKTFQELGTCLY